MLNRIRQAMSPILHDIYQHPFISKLVYGSLPEEIFRCYIEQDKLFLADFSKAMRLTAGRLKNKEHTDALKRTRTTAIQDELSANNNYLNNRSFPFFLYLTQQSENAVLLMITQTICFLLCMAHHQK